MTSLRIRLPDSLHRRISELARRDGITRVIAVAVSG
jgi:predicted transcriptional regulator